MVLVNGKPAQSIDYSDRGLNYGDGLFETMVVLDGKIRFFEAHMQRLQMGCERLSLPILSAELVQKEIAVLLQSLSNDPAVIKLLVTRGSGGRGYIATENPQCTRVLSLHPYPDKVMRFWQDGIATHVCQQRLALNPTLAGFKHLNRLEQVLASSERAESGFDEGLMLSTSDNVIEGTMSNLFWAKDGVFYTPDLRDCGIEGVIRGKLIEHLENSNQKLVIGNYLLEDILEADQVMLTNSTMLLAQVTSIEDMKWSLSEDVEKLRTNLAGMI